MRYRRFSLRPEKKEKRSLFLRGAEGSQENTIAQDFW